MKAKIVHLWLILMVVGTTLPDAVPSLAGPEKALASYPAGLAPAVLPTGDATGVEIGVSGGVVDLPGGGDLTVPQGALSSSTRFSRYTVEMSQAGGLRRYHPLAEAVHVEARRSDSGTPVNTLQKPATVRLKLSRPISERSQIPAVRVQQATGWDPVASSYDQQSKTLTVSLSNLPVTLAIVDDSEPPGSGEWDPSDPAAVQLGDGSWGVAYTDAANPAHTLYRRYLAGSDPPYWLDAVTVDTGANQYDTPVPALVKFSSTLALFYRKATGSPSVKQVFMRTTTDDGITWSSATQLTTESADIYQLQASNVSGTVYLFFSLSNTSGLLQYRTSTDLSNWSAKTSVGRAIGPLQSSTYPSFDIKRLSSGTWGLAWLDPDVICLPQDYPNPPCSYTDHNAATLGYAYPTVWYGTSTDLSATTWSNVRELTLPATNPWPVALSLAQGSSGTVYISYRRYNTAWGSSSHYGFYQSSTDDGANWSGETLFAYEPGRDTGTYSAVFAENTYLAVDNNGNIRAFWDQWAQNLSGLTDGYPTQLFRRDLPSGAIIPVSAVKEIQSQCGVCVPWAAFGADPVNVTTGNFTLAETDVAIPAPGPDLAFQRSYNSMRPVDGPLGFGWTHSYSTTLTAFTHGEVLIVDSSGRSDLYTPAGGGAYNPPPGHYSTLVQNGDGTWTLTEKDQTKKNYSSGGKLTGLADRNNNSLSLSYDGNGKLTSVTDPAGRGLSFGYTGSHISAISDTLTRTVSFGYNGAGDLTSVVDMRGKTWNYTYDGSHRMLTKVDPNSSTVLSNTYGGLERVIRQRDANNAETTFEYSDSGGSTVKVDPLWNGTAYDTQYRVTQVVDPYGKNINYYYDGSNNLTQVRDARKGIYDDTYFTYDSRSNVLTRKNGLGKIWSSGYNTTNDVITTSNPLNYTSVYTYNAAGNLTAATNALSETTNFGRDSYGQLTWVTDARGKTSTFGYDTYGSVVTTTNPYSNTWVSAYDLAGRKASATDPLSHTVSYGYDANSNLTSTTDGRGMVYSYTYDNANNRLTAANPEPRPLTITFGYDQKNRLITVTNALTGTTIYGYDANDYLTSLRDASSHTRTWGYDKLGRVVTETDALGFSTTYEYDGAGNRTKSINANGSITTHAYDTINRLTSTSYPTGKVTYGYDNANRRTSMADGTGATTYAYDKLDRVITATLPGSRVVSNGYDASGNRTRTTYPDGKRVDYTYDDASRMASVTDWLTKTTSYTYDVAGRLITTTFPTGVAEARTYFNSDHLGAILATKGGQTLTSFGYSIDNAGYRWSVQDTAGWENYTYDDLYRVTGATYTGGAYHIYGYDPVGNRLTDYSSSTEVTTTYTYDNGDRLTAAGAITYTYDSNSNQKTRTSGGATTSYCWDVFDRLVRVADSAATSACPVEPVRLNSGGAAYVDVAGNNWAPDTFFTGGTAGFSPSGVANTTDDPLYQAYRTGPATNPFTYTIPLSTAGSYTVTLKFNEPSKTAANQRKFDVSLEGTLVLDDFDIYAAAGGRNIAVDRSFAVTVTDGILNVVFGRVLDNPMVSAIEVVWAGASPATPLVTYTYRGDGLRNSKTVTTTATTTYTWDLNAGLPVVLQDGSQSYVYGLGGLLSQTDGSGNQSYFLGNGLGSTEGLTDGSGNVVATYKYDVFGAVRSSTGTGSTEYRFTAQQDDATAGYTYLRARYYDPATGRFISKDPFPGMLTNPASQHYYAYAYNNPINVTDPTGQAGGTDVLFGRWQRWGGPGVGPGGIGILILGYMAVGRALEMAGEIQAFSDVCSQRLGQTFQDVGQVFEDAGVFFAERNPAQDKKLSKGEIKSLKEAGIGVEELKGGDHAGQRDLYKDQEGNIYVKPKGGQGPGEETGLNINDY